MATFTEFKQVERSRRYHFPGGDVVEVCNVTRVCSMPDGTCRLETLDGAKWSISPDWIAIEYDMDDWR